MFRAAALGSVLVLALLAAGQARKPSAPNKKGVGKMSTVEQTVAALGELDDATLLRGDPYDVIRRAYGLVGPLTWTGLALRAPSAADVRHESRLPILAAFAQSGAREREVVAGDTAIVVVTALEGTGQWIVPLFPPPPLKIPDPDHQRPAPAAPADQSTIASTAVQRLDLKEHDAISWQAGHYAIRVLYWDWVSNTARVTLSGPPVQRAAALLPHVASRGDVNAPTVFPNFFKTKYSPEAPAAGLALRLPNRPIPHGKPLPVFGSASVPAGAADVLPASILLVRKNVLSPIVLDLDIPIFPEDRRPAGEMMSLYFAYDLNAVASAPLPSAEYQAYVIAGEHTAGPYPLTIE